MVSPSLHKDWWHITLRRPGFGSFKGRRNAIGYLSWVSYALQ